MAELSSFEIPFQYSESDQYIRAIRYNLIRKNGEIMPGAFKSRRGGVSVTRTNESIKEYALAYMNAHFEGIKVTFSRTVCDEYSISETHSPSPGHNLHHWELYGDTEESDLSDIQILALIKASGVVG